MTSLVGLKVFQVDPSDGSFISGVEETTMLMKPSGRNYMELDSSDNVYIAMQDINNKYLIVSI